MSSLSPKMIGMKTKKLLYWMKNPMAYVHNESHGKKNMYFSEDFRLRSTAIQKPFQTKRATSVVARLDRGTENQQLRSLTRGVGCYRK